MSALPTSIYVHLPWCVRKCPYCDFNSHRLPDNKPFAAYVDALLVDLDEEARRAPDREIVSVFFGGGTPSLFPPEEIDRVINRMRHHFALDDSVEITLEANPGTVETGDPVGFRDAGVNRLSFGAQSFDANQLNTLGRIHSVADTQQAVDAAKRAGFDNINIDIMYALPSQTLDAALSDLRAGIALDTTHLSWYQLTLEENTAFYANPPPGIPDDDAAWAMQQAGQALLADHGFEQYEVSAYSRPGWQCQHNLNYWSFGDYLAIGAGAHGKLTAQSVIARRAKPANPRAYVEAMGEGGTTAVATVDGAAERTFEFMLNALRLNAGFSERDFEARTGVPVTTIAASLEKCRDRGFLEQPRAGIWRTTAQGKQFLNELTAEFLP